MTGALLLKCLTPPSPSPASPPPPPPPPRSQGSHSPLPVYGESFASGFAALLRKWQWKVFQGHIFFLSYVSRRRRGVLSLPPVEERLLVGRRRGQEQERGGKGPKEFQGRLRLSHIFFFHGLFYHQRRSARQSHPRTKKKIHKKGNFRAN